MSNFYEMTHGTDPGKADTDGDGISDGNEVMQGSDPADGNDGGNPVNCMSVELTVGDHSGSHSERYGLLVGHVYHVAPMFGEVATTNYHFVKGKEYTFRVQWIDTKLSSPDWDYKALIGGLGGGAGWLSGNGFQIHDPDGILGDHWESTYDFAAGKSGTLYITGVKIDLEAYNGLREWYDPALLECVEENPGMLIVEDDGLEPPAGQEEAQLVVKAVGASGYTRWLTFSDHTKVKLNGVVPATNPLQVSGDSNVDMPYKVTPNGAWQWSESITVTLTAKKDGNTISGSDTVKLVPFHIELEPVTLLPGEEILSLPLHNPCGIESGKTAAYQVTVKPDSLPDEKIIWNKVSGSISFPGGLEGETKQKGRVVSIKGDDLDAAKAKVEIEEVTLDPAPTIEMEVLEKKTAKVKVYIVKNEIGETPWSPAMVPLFNVNQLYQQVALEFVQTGAVTYITSKDFYEIDNWQEADDLRSTNFNTEAVEMYFVNKIEIEDVDGINSNPDDPKAGLIVEYKESNQDRIMLLAHELGHGCNLEDIYIKEDGTSLGDDLVREAWVPKDWNSGPGPQYYSTTLKHETLVKRLLMCGRETILQGDISRGRIYGVDLIGWLREEGLAVGLENLNRDNPHHW